jgi:hypothetical protein
VKCNLFFKTKGRNLGPSGGEEIERPFYTGSKEKALEKKLPGIILSFQKLSK